jgi:uncharacterized membrane protein HdeD (DUF308 family)
MNTPSGSFDVSQARGALAKSVRDHWVAFLVEGIVLVILGMFAIFVPLVASLAATVFFGSILLVAGIVGLITTLSARHAPGFSWSVMSAVLGIVTGALLLASPVTGTISLTVVLIAFLFIEGVVSVMFAIQHRRQESGSWGWMLASGALDVVLAAILFAGLPGTALWALGLLIGINMLFGGWSLIAMSLSARPGAATAA